MEGPTSVPTSAPKAGKASGKAPLRAAVQRHKTPKVRKNGMVKSTILFDPSTNEQLTALAFAWDTDRSELARHLVAAGLRHYDVAEEVRKAAAKFAGAVKSSDAGESDEDKDRLQSAASVNLAGALAS
jgi:hypothetical protein